MSGIDENLKIDGRAVCLKVQEIVPQFMKAWSPKD